MLLSSYAWHEIFSTLKRRASYHLLLPAGPCVGQNQPKANKTMRSSPGHKKRQRNHSLWIASSLSMVPIVRGPSFEIFFLPPTSVAISMGERSRTLLSYTFFLARIPPSNHAVLLFLEGFVIFFDPAAPCVHAVHEYKRTPWYAFFMAAPRRKS